MTSQPVEDLLRQEAPQVLAALVRRYGHFHLAEEAVQEALLEAATTWQRIPDRPRGWLIRVAQRRLIDSLRGEYARVAREERFVLAEPDPTQAEEPSDDDSLDLLVLCCHPSLTRQSAVALTLRAVGGLTTDEIAAAFLVPSATMGQRIARAKATITASGIGFGESTADVDSRLESVLTVLYLIFNEGYSASSGDLLVRVDLAAEAIRLTRMLYARLPDRAEVGGLLALMLLHQARRPARERDGLPVPIADQDRSLWDQQLIAEGTALLDRTMSAGPPGRFQLLAAISALHNAAASDAETDWLQILGLYDLLRHFDPSPMLLVSRAVAVARVHGPEAGLVALASVGGDARLARSHRIEAVRAHLLDRAGDPAGAAVAFRRAARATRSVPEQRYLLQRAADLSRSLD